MRQQQQNPVQLLDSKKMMMGRQQQRIIRQAPLTTPTCSRTVVLTSKQVLVTARPRLLPA
jgi:hypothetical protein